jgi:hypothetical protein
MIREVHPLGGDSKTYFRAVAMMGSNVEMSIPTISGFPLMDQTPYREYMKQMYMVDKPNDYVWSVAAKNKGKQFAWVSWEIMSEWSMRPAGFALKAENTIAIEDNGKVDGQDWYGNQLEKNWYKGTYGNTTYIASSDYWE